MNIVSPITYLRRAVRVFNPFKRLLQSPGSYPELSPIYRKLRHLQRDLVRAQTAASNAQARADAAYTFASREKKKAAEGEPAQAVNKELVGQDNGPQAELRPGVSLSHLRGR